MDVNWIVDSPFEALPVGDAEKTALSIEGLESWTYRELRDRRNRWIGVLHDVGVARGDHVGVFMTNTLDYVALYFAIARIGAVVVRLNFRLSPPELEYILGDSECSVVVFHTDLVAQIEPIRANVAVRTWFGVERGETPVPAWAAVPALADADADECGLPRPHRDDLLMLMYTSGTTGRPKGVMWTHDNALSLAMMEAVKWSYTPDMTAMTTGPLYHAGAFEVLLLPALFVHGTAVMMASGAMSIDRIVESVRRAEVNHALLYPFMLYDLLRSDHRPEDVPTLKAILTGGDPVQSWALEQVEERFPGIEVQQGFGLTEGGTSSTCLDHVDRLANAGTVGRPSPLTTIRVMSEDGTQAPIGEVGEVWVTSPTVAIGYWKNPEATAETFVDGWCRTGDLGRVTENGFLAITGRAKDMIRSGGENIYPAEIESMLGRHPGVHAIAVVAVPDQKYLEVGCAVVVPAAPAEPLDALEQRLRAYCAENLAGYKRPKHWVFTDALPMNAGGKVLKNVLRDQYAHLGSAPRPAG